ncbi:MAG TPA: hypothetical protein VFW62_05515, partial [bacterium]|nr:hypothetical protein [bacterium]
MLQLPTNPRLKLAMYFAAVLLAVAIVYSVPSPQQARAQSGGTPAAAEGGPSSTPVPAASSGAEAPGSASAKKPSKSIDIFALAVAGGIFMIPILGMSILAATMTIERFIGLRKQRVIP